jgi:pantoate--beta-alanine ligase
MSLVRAAKVRADRVVVSIFVNPLQFSAGEDFEAYPRSMDGDFRALEMEAVDVVFAPRDETLYPHGREGLTQVIVPELSGQFCGEFRAGHFEGVTTVVCLLLNIVQPDYAVFGQKDYQQLTIIRSMVRDLHLPVEIVGAPTVREPSGLAMSSRNAFLTQAQRAQAASIYQCLKQAAEALQSGHLEFGALQAKALKQLADAGLQPEFFEIRAANLSLPDAATQHFVILVAARIGSTRLIDNIEVGAAAP